MRRLAGVSLLVSFAIAGLSGCWNLVEVDRRAMVTTFGIDRSKTGRVTVTLQIPNPENMLPPVVTGGGASGRRFTMVSQTADTVRGAFDALQTRTFRELVTHQNKSIIVGEEVARRGVTPVFDSLWRNPRAPSQALVFVADGSTAKELLSPEPAQQTLAGLQFFTRAQSPLKSDRVFFMPLWLFQQKHHHSSKDPYAALVRFDRTQKTYVCSGIAVFDGDRMSGKLNAPETQLFGLLANITKSVGLTLKNVGMGRAVSLETVKARTTINVRKGPSEPSFQIDVRLYGVVSEVFGSNAALTAARTRSIEKETARALKTRMEAVIRKLQGFNADVIDLGEQLRVQRPDMWRGLNWKKVYSAVPIKVNVRVHLLGDGTVE